VPSGIHPKIIGGPYKRLGRAKAGGGEVRKKPRCFRPGSLLWTSRGRKRYRGISIMGRSAPYRALVSTKVFVHFISTKVSICGAPRKVAQKVSR
jgi:hypothetical protein